MSSEFEIKMEKEFNLSKASQAFFAFLVLFVSFIPYVLDAGSYTKIGILIELGIILIITYFLSWLTWFIFAKKDKAGNFAFKLIIASVILVKLVYALEVDKSYNEKYKLKHIESFETYKFIDNNLHFLIFTYKDNETSQKIKSILSSLIEEVSQIPKGDEYKSLNALSNLLTQSEKDNAKWKTSFEDFNNLAESGYSQLNSKADFNFHRLIVKTYISETKAYKERASKFLENLEFRLESWDINKESFVFKSLKYKKDNKRFNSIMSSFKAFMEENIKQAIDMLNILDFLEENKKSWRYIDGELVIDKEKFKLYKKLEAKFNDNKVDKALSSFRRSLNLE